MSTTPHGELQVTETRKLLLGTLVSDVDQFIDYWQLMNTVDPNGFPLNLTSDLWIKQFWAWIEGE